MSFNQDKLSAFARAVDEEAEHKIEQLEKEADEYRAAQLKQAKEEEYNRMFGYMQEQVQMIKSKHKQSVTKYELDQKRGLVQFRNQLTDRVFDEVRERLAAFSQTEAYAEYLVSQISAAVTQFPYKPVCVLVKEEDLRFSETLQRILPGQVTVEADPENRLGGFILLSREHGVMADETFAEVLKAQKEKFYSTCGLTIEY